MTTSLGHRERRSTNLFPSRLLRATLLVIKKRPPPKKNRTSRYLLSSLETVRVLFVGEDQINAIDCPVLLVAEGMFYGEMEYSGATFAITNDKGRRPGLNKHRSSVFSSSPDLLKRTWLINSIIYTDKSRALVIFWFVANKCHFTDKRPHTHTHTHAHIRVSRTKQRPVEML